MGGIFLGFLCAVLLLAVLGRLRASHPPRGALGIACWVLIALTGFDGLNAFFYDGGLPHLYAPLTVPRLLTGLGAGLSVGLMAVPVVASLVWARPTDESSIEEPVELLGGLSLVGLVGALILSGASALLWPIAIAMLAGVLVAFGVANLYVIAAVSSRVRGAAALAELRGGLIASLGLALLEMAGLSALRALLIAVYGFSWGL